MRWEDIEERFGLDIPVDEPILPFNVVCQIVDIQYHLLHEILKQGVLRRPKKQRSKKLLSVKDIKRLRYVKYLIEERGVNISGIKVIFELGAEEE